MLKLRYFPITYALALMPALTYAADAAQKKTVDVYYQYLNLKPKSAKMTFLGNKVSTKDFIKKCWGVYIKKVPKEKLTANDIAEDFRNPGLKGLSADKVAVIVQRKTLADDRVAIVPYEKSIDLNESNKKIGINVESIKKIKKTLQRSLKDKDVPEEYLLSNLIKAEKERRKKESTAPGKGTFFSISAIGGSIALAVKAAVGAKEKPKKKKNRQKKGTVTKKANDAKGKKQKSK